MDVGYFFRIADDESVEQCKVTSYVINWRLTLTRLHILAPLTIRLADNDPVVPTHRKQVIDVTGEGRIAVDDVILLQNTSVTDFIQFRTRQS